MELAKEVVDCGLWYLAEYEGPAVSGRPGGAFSLTRDPRSFTSVEAYLRRQGRFRADDASDLAALEAARDERWAFMRDRWA